MLTGSVSPRAAASMLQTLTLVFLGVAVLMALRGFFAVAGGNSFNPFASGEFTFWDRLIQAWGTSITTFIAALLAWCGAVYFNHVADMRDRERSSAKYLDAGPPPVPGRRSEAAAAAAPRQPSAPQQQAPPQQTAEEVMFSSPDAAMSASPLFGDAPQRTPGAPPVPDDRGAGAAVTAGAGDALSAMPSPIEVERPPTVRQGDGGQVGGGRSGGGRVQDDRKPAARRVRSDDERTPKRRPEGEKRRPAEGGERKRRPPQDGERSRRAPEREGERPRRRPDADKRDGGGRARGSGERPKRQRPPAERPPRRRPPEDR